jgi:hypothetical protein
MRLHGFVPYFQLFMTDRYTNRRRDVHHAHLDFYKLTGYTVR